MPSYNYSQAIKQPQTRRWDPVGKSQTEKSDLIKLYSILSVKCYGEETVSVQIEYIYKLEELWIYNKRKIYGVKTIII